MCAHLQKAQQHRKGHLMGSAVCAWKAHAARQAQLSSLTADIVAKHLKRLSASSFAGWQQRASRKRINKAKVRLCWCHRPISTSVTILYAQCRRLQSLGLDLLCRACSVTWQACKHLQLRNWCSRVFVIQLSIKTGYVCTARQMQWCKLSH